MGGGRSAVTAREWPTLEERTRSKIFPAFYSMKAETDNVKERRRMARS